MKYLLPICILIFVTACQPNQAWFPEDNNAGTNEGGTTPDILPSVRMSDRNATTSLLTALFIPSSVAVDEATEKTDLQNVIQFMVKDQAGDFGGSCDKYGGSTVEDCTVGGVGNAFAGTDRNIARDPDAATWGAPTSLRAAFSLRTVYDLLVTRTNELALRQIIALTRGTTYNLVNVATLTQPTTADVNNLFDLIFPGKAPSADTIQKLLALSSSVASQDGAKESWRYLVLAILSSLDWQIL